MEDCYNKNSDLSLEDEIEYQKEVLSLLEDGIIELN